MVEAQYFTTPIDCSLEERISKNYASSVDTLKYFLRYAPGKKKSHLPILGDVNHAYQVILALKGRPRGLDSCIFTGTRGDHKLDFSLNMYNWRVTAASSLSLSGDPINLRFPNDVRLLEYSVSLPSLEDQNDQDGFSCKPSAEAATFYLESDIDRQLHNLIYVTTLQRATRDFLILQGQVEETDPDVLFIHGLTTEQRKERQYYLSGERGGLVKGVLSGYFDTQINEIKAKMQQYLEQNPNANEEIAALRKSFEEAKSEKERDQIYTKIVYHPLKKLDEAIKYQQDSKRIGITRLQEAQTKGLFPNSISRHVGELY